MSNLRKQLPLLLELNEENGQSASDNHTKPSLVWEVSPEHGSRPWVMDLTQFADGANGLTARAELIHGLVDVLRTDSRGRKVEFRPKATRCLSRFWEFLDTIEERSGSQIKNVAEVTTDLGQQFKNWLIIEQRLSLNTAKTVLNYVQRLLQLSRKFHGIENYTLAWPTIRSDRQIEHKDVDPDLLKPLYHELKRQHSMTRAMRAEGESLLAQGSDPRPVKRGVRNGATRQDAFADPANLAWLANEWTLHSFEHPKTTMRQFGGNYFADPTVREIPPTAPSALPNENRTRFDTVRWHHPTVEDTAAAYFLVLLHTGWNPETVDNIDISSKANWCDHRLGAEEGDPDRVKTVAIYGYKGKVGKEQIAFSLYRPSSHPYQVITSMIRWTEPMRQVLRERLCQFESKGALTKKERDTVAWLKEYIRSPFLYFSPKAAGPCGLRIACFRIPSTRGRMLRQICQKVVDDESAKFEAKSLAGWSDLEAEFSAKTKLEGVRKLTDLKPSDFRDGFAAFLYDNSLYNILLVKRALGHGDLKSTRHYLRQKRQIAQRFREFRNFQEIFFEEIRLHQSIDPTILFLRTRHGEISSDQRDFLRDYRNRTRMEMGCIDPTNPPDELVAARGEVCMIHRCTICRHGVVFEGSLDGLAVRAAELRYIRGRSAMERFLESSFHKEWVAIEWIFDNFFESRMDVVEASVEKAYQEILSGERYVFDQVPLVA